MYDERYLFSTNIDILIIKLSSDNVQSKSVLSIALSHENSNLKAYSSLFYSNSIIIFKLGSRI